MSSIGSTINVFNPSLLSQIGTRKSQQSQSSASSSPAASASSSSDTADFSEIAQLMKTLQQLKTTDPVELKQVLTSAAARFKTAASEASDSRQASVLDNVADRFEKAAGSGDLSFLLPSST